MSFVEACFGDRNHLAAVSDELTARLGAHHLVDAVAVVANFHMMTRIADATGTPLDPGTAGMSGELRNDLGLDALTSARL